MADGFNLGGLLGGAFGGGELDDLLTPEQRAAIQRQAGLSAAAALLQAAGPSATRTTLGQALGSALTAGQTGMQTATQSALTQMLTRQKLEEAKRARDVQARIAGVLTGEGAPVSAQGEVTPAGALAAPGMAVGPTVERAAMIGQRVAQPERSPNEVKAAQYRQIADVYAASGKGEEAKRFMDIAEQLAPSREEFFGDPIKTATGYVQRTKTGFKQLPKEFEPAAKPTGLPQVATEQATGKQVLVQQYDDGSQKIVDQFGPARDVVIEKFGDRAVAVDKRQVAPGTQFRMGLAPQVVGGAETGYYVLGGGGGAAPAAPRAPAAGGVASAAQTGGVAPAAPAAAPAAAGPQPIIPGTGKKPPEAFSKAVRQLNDLRGSIDDYKQTLATTDWIYPKNIPIPFTESGLSLPTGSDTAAVSSRYNSLLMGVKNLYELGALTGPDLSIIERQITNPASWAGLLTSRKAMNEQVKVLEDMVNRAEKNLASAYGQPVPSAAPVESEKPKPSPNVRQQREGATSVDNKGNPIVYRNGKWEYQQ